MINYEIIVGIITAIIGSVAVAVTIKAKRKMSNPELLKYMRYVMLSMSALILFSLWHTAREAFELKEKFGAVIEMPEYLFVSLTYLLFLIGALAIFKMSKIYGFKEEAGEINLKKAKKTP